MAFVFEEQKIPGVFVITPQVFGDSRGYFTETFKAPDFAAHGIPTAFVQDNESSSSKGVLRGLGVQVVNRQIIIHSRERRRIKQWRRSTKFLSLQHLGT